MTQWERGLKGGHLVIETRRISSRTVVTVQRRQSNLLLGTYVQTRPSRQALETCDTGLQLIVNDTSSYIMAYFGCFHSCNVILLLCILIIDLSIRFSFALFETYAPFYRLFSAIPDGSRGGRVLIHALWPSYCTFFIYRVRIDIQHFILPFGFLTR